MRGGNIVNIAERLSLLPDSSSQTIMNAIIASCPPQLSTTLWDIYCRKFNYSQLYAIKHVVEMDFRTSQDTHVTLIQGPPGTGY
jgi:hypothetical protein